MIIAVGMGVGLVGQIDRAFAALHRPHHGGGEIDGFEAGQAPGEVRRLLQVADHAVLALGIAVMMAVNMESLVLVENRNRGSGGHGERV